jgi:hypothetical protein
MRIGSIFGAVAHFTFRSHVTMRMQVVPIRTAVNRIIPPSISCIVGRSDTSIMQRCTRPDLMGIIVGTNIPGAKHITIGKT